MMGATDRKKVLILGGSRLQAPAIEVAKRLGFWVICADYDPDAVGFALADQSELISTLDAEAVLALAPLSVLPDYQNRGIRLSLMKEGHSIAHKLGYEYSVVLGHSKYYPKAGYIPASECGIKAPFEVDDESFMALNLNGSQNKLNGVIEYDKAFGI